MVAYKIVSVYSSEYESLIMSGVARVVYKIGKRAVGKPNCGPLAAFESMDDVISFKKSCGWTDNPVFKCRVRKYRGKRKTLWTNIRDSTLILPKGTILCSSITLISEVI